MAWMLVCLSSWLQVGNCWTQEGWELIPQFPRRMPDKDMYFWTHDPVHIFFLQTAVEVFALPKQQHQMTVICSALIFLPLTVGRHSQKRARFNHLSRQQRRTRKAKETLLLVAARMKIFQRRREAQGMAHLQRVAHPKTQERAMDRPSKQFMLPRNQQHPPRLFGQASPSLLMIH